MFKIENYVTPIILNYVAKYVKNIRPQDAQLSLWEGEVVFHNLDLRLEVLEDELNLPFEFLSGHIHELSIRVPWTKITSEPIRIDINTIEFVLKLKDERGDGTGSSASSSPQRQQGTDGKSRRINKYDDQQQAQQSSGGSGLVNKIINNIAVQCHNIILKYVEEDIVVSMNVQLLSFGSADEQWKPAMVDVHPLKVFMRKLVQISDLTICLDKRNAAGQIDVCQEPLLYRCSLECRILRKYNIQSLSSTSITRIGILTKSLDMNVSALQFPMAMRLFKLILALKSGELKNLKATADISEGDIDEPVNNQSEGSYLSWAWNLLPSFNFQSAEEEHQISEPAGHVFDIGVYVEQLNFTLKNAEFVIDSILGTTKRIRYTPIVRIIMSGMYFENISVIERNWGSMKAGISSIYIEPLGTYRCDEKLSNAILETNSLENVGSFIDKSLFDTQYNISDKSWGVANYEEYKTHITDEYLLFRSPVLAFDIIEYNSSKHDTTSTATNENLSKDNHVEYRVLSSGFTFRHCESFLQVKHIVNEFIKSYDYPAYYAEKLEVMGPNVNVPKLHPPLMEDYDSLMQHIPLRTYRFDLKKVRCEFHARTEAPLTQKNQQRRSSVGYKHVLPFFELYLEQTEGAVSTPLNPDKLVHTTCQLPDKPIELLNACYNNYQLSLKDLSLSLVKTGIDESCVRLLYIPRLQFSYGNLLQPDLWRSEDIAIKKLDGNCEKFIIDITKKDVITTQRLLSCILMYRHKLLSKIVRQAALNQQRYPLRLQAEFGTLVVQQRCYKQHNIWNVCLRSLQAFVVVRRSFEEFKHLVFNSSSKAHNNQPKWLEWQGQFPVNDVDTELKATMGLWMDRYQLFMDSTLIEFLQYQEEPESVSDRETLFEVEIQTQVFQSPSVHQGIISQQSNTSSARRTSRHSMPTRKVSHPEETIHFSSERDDKIDVEAINSTTSVGITENNQMSWIRYAQSLIFSVEIGQGKLNIAKSFRRAANGQIISEFTEILLPKIVCKSTHAEYISRSNMWQKVVTPAASTLNWKLSLNDFGIQNHTLFTTESILEPIQTTITIALTHKKEKIKSLHKHLEVMNFKKIVKKKHSTDSHPTIDIKNRETRKTGSDDAGSVAADGRTNSMEDEEDNSNDGISVNHPRNEDDKEIADTSKKQINAQKNIVTLTLHADTSSIHFLVSSEKVKVLHDHLGIMLKVLQLFHTTGTSMPMVAVDPVKILTATEEHTSLKEFLDLETNSETSKTTEDKNDVLFVASFFCQWTVTKIIIELETGEPLQKCKMTLELEDLLSTMDKHEDFSKYTSKMGNFSLNYYKPNLKGDWEAHEGLRIKMFAETANLPFFNIIYTCVGLKSFYNRIGAKRKGDLNRTISEVVITMQAIEVIMDLDKIAIFVVPLCVLFQKTNKSIDIKASKSTNDKNSPNTLSTIDLPLLHLDCKGFTLYMPLDAEKKSCSVVIWKLEGIKITPNLENPLQRSPLRPDVYSKAAQMGILSTPGALVEDRQYELTLRNISAATGNWDQILAHMREQANNFHRTNPAFEWNNQNRKTALQLTELFNNFKFVAIYAPSIIYNNILICGTALEFNCASDFIASVNTSQLHLLSSLFSRFNNISRIINERYYPHTLSKVSTSVSQTTLIAPQNSLTARPLKRTSRSLPTFYSAKSLEHRYTHLLDVRASSSVFDSIDEDTEHNFKTDSGFQSHNSRIPPTQRVHKKDRLASISSNSSLLMERNEHTHATITRHTPYTISLVAGVFIIKIFDISYDLQHSKEPENKPLLALTITQPSFMSAQNIYDSTMHISLFNLNVHMGSSTVEPTVPQSPKANLFPDSLFETRIGELSPTGIPPALFSFKTHRTKNQLMEIDIEMQRPILLKMTEEYAKHLCKSSLLIYETLLENSLFDMRTEQAIVRGSKIRLIREQTFQADRLHIKFKHIALKLTDEINYNCKLFCSDLKLNMKFLNRPEKVSLKGSIGAIYMQTEKKIFLHPVTLRYSLDFISEPWHRLPLVIGAIKLNVLRFDVGINGLLQLRETFHGFERISAQFNREWFKFLKEHQSDYSQYVAQDQLTIMKCPKVGVRNKSNNRKSKIQREEFYQDDLRAGAFQFVELVTDSFLPLPYQIQIIKKDYGIICWRYPQPRKMCKIHIYPVPMAVANPVRIRCRMEYFSEVHESFQHYCDFWLSETVSKQITLPEHEICANIWRVVILQSLVSVNGESFDTSEDDEELRSISSTKIDEVLKGERKEADFILHPKVLVGCMRIDTAFQSDSVPKVQLLVSCNMLQVKLLNQPTENVELPSLLKKFRLAHVSPISQTFMEFVLERMNLHCAFYTMKNYTLDSSMNCQIKCLDYGFLNMLYLLEPTTFQSYICVDKVKRNMTVNLVLDKVRLNLGPTIVHSLLSSKMHWDELLESQTTQKRHALIPKCIVVNRTMSQLSFGQTGTTERIHLQPKECHLYSFRSDYHSQELTFFVADEESRITEVSQSVSIPFKFEGDVMLQTIRIGNKCIIIKSKRLSASQIYVLIKGQIELVSMVGHDLRVEFRREGKQGGEKHVQEYPIEGNGRCSYYRSIHSSSNIVMRLKFGNSKGKGRSGDIPLRANKNLPWLVKVPTQNNDFVSLWIRIVREDIPEASSDKFHPQKVLITIWPIFMVSSMLSSAVQIVESSTNKSIELNPHGGRQALSVPATHLTEHKIDFQYNFMTSERTLKEYTLTLKAMDWNKFFWYEEEKWNIEYALQELSKGVRHKWPMTDEEELRVKRLCNTVAKTDVQYKCIPSRDFSCTVCLEVSPWGMFINATGLTVSICDCSTNDRITIDSNYVATMFCIEKNFTIDIENGSNWLASLPIYFNPLMAEHKSGRSLLLAENSYVDIVILRNDQVLKFVLELKIESDRKIFKLRSKFVATNFSKNNLCILPFAMDHKECIKREDIVKFDAGVQTCDLEPVKNTENSIGLSLDFFYDLNSKKSTRSKDTAFVCFACIKICSDSHISIPIPLSMPFTRRCFSIQNGADSIPLLVTLTEKDNIYYLNIFEDVSPAIFINNQTDVNFIVAQTSASENSKVTNTTPEYEGRHFEWYQLLPAQSNCYYTPPEMYASFPDVESTMCNLTLAVFKDDITKKNIKWSKPIRTDKTWEKFLHVPNHGDVKVTICDKHRVIKVSIYYIAQQLEFSVKDLRSRLMTPASVPDINQQSGHMMVESDSSIPVNVQPLPAPTCIHFQQECEIKMQLKLRVYAKEFMFSIHTDAKDRDYMKCEVFSMYMDDVIVAYEDDDDRKQMNLLIPNLQLDNQLYSTGKYDFPVVLCAQELYTRTVSVPQVYYLEKTYQELRSQQPMVLITLNFFIDELKIDSIDCKLSPLRAYIEDAYLNDLFEALLECEPFNCVYKPKPETTPLVLYQGQVLLPKDIVAESCCIAEPLQLRSFRIEPLTVLLSVHTSVRLYIALDHSPLSFSTYERQRILTMPLRFGQSVGMHFLSGAIFGAGWVVGSLEILGSPSGLARSFSTGLRDFVSMPMQGLFRGPWGFIVGITQGSASLLRNVTAGTVNSVTKLAASVARNLDRLSLDQEHIERTEALRRSRPRGFTEGFSQGITGLGISILGAVGGLAHHTLEARSPVEVMTGMGKGLVGALTKPLSGAAELLALAGQGMLHTVGFNAMPQHRSPSVCHNIAVGPSSYRIWKLLPSELISDQILFHQEVTLVLQGQLSRGYVFLTSAVFALLEAQWDRLALVLPVKKVDLTSDRDDKTLIYVRLIKETDDIEEDLSYTNQRIMSFLRSSFSVVGLSAMTTDSLDDLLQTQTAQSLGHGQEQSQLRDMDWKFYINEQSGEHLIQYLNIINHQHHQC